MENLANMSQTQKIDFVEQLMLRHATLHQALREQTHAREVEFHRHAAQVVRLEEQIHALRSESVLSYRDDQGHIILLINGDDLTFDHASLSAGEMGGYTVAKSLLSSIEEYLKATLPNLVSQIKVIVRIYADVSNLALKLKFASATDSMAILQNFIRAFNSHGLDFDFMDVGSGQFGANSKIEALLDHHMNDPLCRQIIFGVDIMSGFSHRSDINVDHDGGPYLYVMHSVWRENELNWLEPVTRISNFDNIFYSSTATYDELHQESDLKPEASNSNSSDSPSSDTTVKLHSLSIHKPQPLPSPVAQMSPPESKKTTWASIVGTAVPSARKEIAPLPAPGSKTAMHSSTTPSINEIPRNVHGQRIDPFYPATEEEWRRVQQLHVCNNYFLRRECPYGKKCSHAHKVSPEDGGLPDGSLSQHDLMILGQVSRYAPCRYGTSCDDIDCIYGHRCPVVEHDVSYGKNAKGRVCKFGKSCKFLEEMHMVDLKVAKSTKI